MREDTIVAAIGKRDEDTMNDVINKYSRLLWPIVSAVLKNVGSEQDAEEVIADTFIFLWEHPGKFDPSRGTLKSWLCMVARSRALDRYRELIRRQTLPLEEAVLAEGFGMQEQLMQADTRRELLAAVNALGEPGREILIRRYYYEQKPREIALALNMTVKQVDNSLYRSKRNLRQALTKP